LTDRKVRILREDNGRTDYTDELVRGSGLRVGAEGSRVYSVGYFAAAGESVRWPLSAAYSVEHPRGPSLVFSTAAIPLVRVPERAWPRLHRRRDSIHGRY
jgi:hypothetical protein